MNNKNNIWIVIPTFNEAQNLRPITEALFALGLPSLTLLVVDDGSPDGTGDLAEELGRQYSGHVQCLHRAGKQGLGTAYIQGFQLALRSGAEIIGQMDADFSHPIDKVPELVKALDEYDLAIGSRYVPGGSLDDNWSFFRKALSGWGNFYARTILGLKLRDVTGGFRFWRRTTLERMPLDQVRSNGYVFQVEMVYLALRLGFKFKEIPIYFKERTVGESKMSFNIQWEAAVRTWQLPWRYRNLKP